MRAGVGLMVKAGNRDGQKLYVRIALQLRAMIEGGEFQPGAKLPPLAQLAEQFGCSRATVREALGALRGQGLIEFRHGDGTYVRMATVDMWMEPVEAALLLSIGQAKQLVELETAVLAGVVSLAAERIDEAQTALLSQALFAVECAVPASEEAIAAALSFYLELADIARNPLLENTLRVLQEAMRSSFRSLIDHPHVGLQVCRRVYDAVCQKNPRTARELIFEFGQTMSKQIELNRQTLAWQKTQPS